jgi:hypothetical protein
VVEAEGGVADAVNARDVAAKAAGE